jgi:hypothetical protein
MRDGDHDGSNGLLFAQAMTTSASFPLSTRLKSGQREYPSWLAEKTAVFSIEL